MAGRRFRVRGRVQGVWYRGATQEKARSLDLAGSAVNLADGSVEVHAYGDPDALDALERWLWQGPRAAEVASVQADDIADAPPHGGFTTA